METKYKEYNLQFLKEKDYIKYLKNRVTSNEMILNNILKQENIRDINIFQGLPT